MDNAIKRCGDLTESEVDVLKRVEDGLGITADVSRADILVYCRLSADKVVVVSQAHPHSISSLYKEPHLGQTVKNSEQPIIFRAFEGATVREQRDRLVGGAPVVQEVYPIRNADGKPIACFSVETNLIERERHRRRNPVFQRVVSWLQGMARQGELEGAAALSAFGEWDGILLIDPQLRIRYLSGIATNLYRHLGYLVALRGQDLGELRTGDDEFVKDAFRTGRCGEVEAHPKDSVWVKKVIPLRQYPLRGLDRLVLPPAWRHPFTVWRTSGGYAGALLLVHDATETRHREQELKVKSYLIKEVHHRVKNNLQTVAALLRMQLRRSDSPEVQRQLEQAVDRIMSVAVIHDFLSHGEGRLINLRDVCSQIVAQARHMTQAPEGRVHLEVRGPDINLTSEQASACALAVNECLQNSLEHGFAGQRSGTITISLEEKVDDIGITIHDDGAGLPSGFDLARSGNLGLQIVDTLVRDDLKGTFTLRNKQGVSAEIHFIRLPLGGYDLWKEPE